MTTSDLGFIHKYIPSSSITRTNDKKSKKLTFLLLHGTGGNEEDLVFLGKEIEPAASLLSLEEKYWKMVYPDSLGDWLKEFLI